MKLVYTIISCLFRIGYNRRTFLVSQNRMEMFYAFQRNMKSEETVYREGPSFLRGIKDRTNNSKPWYTNLNFLSECPMRRALWNLYEHVFRTQKFLLFSLFLMQATVRRLGSQVIKMEGCSGAQKTQCLIRLYETKLVTCAAHILHKIKQEPLPPSPPTHAQWNARYWINWGERLFVCSRTEWWCKATSVSVDFWSCLEKFSSQPAKVHASWK